MALDYNINIGQAAQIAGQFFIVIMTVIFVAACVIFGVIYWKKRKIYSKHKVIVWKTYKTNDGKEIPLIEDLQERGGVLFDKKMHKWVFHLKKANVDMGEEELANMDENRELDMPSVPYGKGGDVLFIQKLGAKKYAFGEPFIFEGNVSVRVSEADLAEAKRSYALFINTFGKKTNPIWAFMIYVIFAVLILLLIYVLVNKFDVIAEAAQNLKLAQEAGVVARGSAVASGAPV